MAEEVVFDWSPEQVDRMDRDRALRLVARKGRTYPISDGKHVSLHVYSTARNDVELLVKFFGGNYYGHRQGFQWQVARAESLQKISDSLPGLGEEFTPQARKRLSLLPPASALPVVDLTAAVEVLVDPPAAVELSAPPVT